MSSARPTSTSDQLLHGIFKATMPQVGTLPMERFPSKLASQVMVGLCATTSADVASSSSSWMKSSI